MHYRGCFLDPKAYELADDSGWTAEVFVASRDGADIVDKGYFLKHKYPSREAALNAALFAGKQEVDRRIAG